MLPSPRQSLITRVSPTIASRVMTAVRIMLQSAHEARHPLHLATLILPRIAECAMVLRVVVSLTPPLTTPVGLITVMNVMPMVLRVRRPRKMPVMSRLQRIAVSVTYPVPLRPRCSAIRVSLITVHPATMVLWQRRPLSQRLIFPPRRIALFAITLRPLRVPGLITRVSLTTVRHVTMEAPPWEKMVTTCQPVMIAVCVIKPRAFCRQHLIMSASWITACRAMMVDSRRVKKLVTFRRLRIVVSVIEYRPTVLALYRQSSNIAPCPARHGATLATSMEVPPWSVRTIRQTLPIL